MQARIEQARLKQHVASLHPIIINNILPVENEQNLALHNALYQRGFTVVIESKKQDFTMLFYFHHDIDVDSLEIRDTINHHIDVFYHAQNLFPLPFNAQPMRIFIDQERLQPLRVRPVTLLTMRTPAPHTPGVLISERLFTTAINTNGRVLALYFNHFFNERIPTWFASGLTDYMMQSAEVTYLDEETLVQWLSENIGFDDLWFVPTFNTEIARSEARNVAYTLVRRWSQAGELSNIISSLIEDKYQLERTRDDYINTLTQQSNNPRTQYFFFYLNEWEVSTPQGIYFFNHRSHASSPLSITRLQESIDYMDAASVFLREFFHVYGDARVVTQIYPLRVPLINYGIQSSPQRSLYYRGFARVNLVVLGYSGFYIHVHELAHAYLLRRGGAPSWLNEGMAVMAELAWLESSFNPIPSIGISRRFYYPYLERIIISGVGAARLPRVSPLYPENVLISYEESGSFVIFLYNRFGKELLLEFYSRARGGANNNHLAYQIFGYNLETLLDDWQRYLILNTDNFVNRRGNWWRVDIEEVLG